MKSLKTMVTSRMLSLPKVFHAVDETVCVESDGSGTDWRFSLVFAGDLTCRLFASPEGDPSSTQLVTTTFSSLQDLDDSLDEWLAKVNLPNAVADAIHAAAPAFRVDAETAGLADQYLYGPK
jgi:hypothetical protein